MQLAIATAFERTGTIPHNIDAMIEDVLTEFPYFKEHEIVKAIRNGALGRYGKTYKLTTQEVCIWLREYRIEENENKQFQGRGCD